MAAAVTVNSFEYAVFGNKRKHLFNVTIASNSDTLDTGLGAIDSFTVLNQADDYATATKSGGTLTFLTDGAETSVNVEVIGS